MTSTIYLPLFFVWLLLAGAPGAGGQGSPDAWSEELHYEWDLGGFLGTLATLFMPGKGDGVLATRSTAEGTLVTELHVTSPASREGEFWLYGAEIDPSGPDTRRVWSEYRFRGEEKRKSQELDEGEVVDIASGIYRLRRDPPSDSRKLRIWSSGRIYAVEARLVSVETRPFDGRLAQVRQLRIEGTRAVEGREWKGRLDLFLADDEAATPVEIVIERDFARLRLTLVSREE